MNRDTLNSELARRERQALINRTHAILVEIDQIFADAEVWNSRHTDSEPIDPDSDGMMGRMRAGLVRTLDREKEISAQTGCEVPQLPPGSAVFENCIQVFNRPAPN